MVNLCLLLGLIFVDFGQFDSSKSFLNGKIERLTESKEINFMISLLELFFLLNSLGLLSQGSAQNNIAFLVRFVRRSFS